MNTDTDMKRVEQVMAEVEATIRQTKDVIARSRQVRERMDFNGQTFDEALGRLSPATRDRVTAIGQEMARKSWEKAQKEAARPKARKTTRPMI